MTLESTDGTRAGGSVARACLLAATGLVALLTFYLYGRFGFTNLGDIADPRMSNHADFSSFHFSASALWSGDDPYPATGLQNLNPPAWMPLFSYAALFEGLIAYRLWVIGSVVALFAALALTTRAVRASTTITLVGVFALMLSQPAQNTLWQGQVYILLALGLVAAWVLERQGRTTAAAVLLGVLAGLKLSLLPMLLWPAAQRRWRDVAAAAGGFVGSFAFGLFFGGPSVTAGWFRLLTDHEQDGSYDNIAPTAQAYRLFTPNSFTGHLATIPWAATATTVLGVLAALATAWWCRRRLDYGFWALVAASLLASPIAWRGYLILLAPAALILLARRRTRASGALMIALLMIPGTWPDLWPDKTSTIAALALTLPTAVLLVYWIVLIVQARTVDRPDEQEPSDTPSAERPHPPAAVLTTS